MKKVLLLNYCWPGQGTYFRAYYFAKGLARAGYQVELVCASATAGDWGIHRRITPEGFTVVTLPSPIRPGAAAAYIMRTVLGSWRVLTGNYDAIHAFGTALPSTSVPAILARRFGKKAKILLDWDDAWGDAYGEMFSPLQHRLLTFLENKTPFWAAPDAVTVVSRYFHVKLLKAGFPENRIQVMPNGADTGIIKPIPRDSARADIGWPLDEKILLSMGHNYFGSLRVLLDTFAQVRAKKPKVKLKMLGKLLKVGKWVEKVEAILGEYAHLAADIEWLGEVPRNEIGKFLCAADCLLLPMHNGVMDEARGPVRLGDYLASGRPIASNAIGYTREILQSASPNAVCDDPDSTAEFAENVLHLIENQHFAELVGKAGLTLAQGKYNWDTIGEDVADLYGGLW
ncbi:MAG: glycosyltransferase family 4 protein [Nitrospinae bacterium]|nr:glycosyltransferase family 4 protein [Nitrospinota bacterium]